MLDEHPDDLLDEERIALGPRQDFVANVVGQRLNLEQVRDELAAVGVGQRLKLYLGRASPYGRARLAHQPPARRIGLRPACEKNQNRHWGEMGKEQEHRVDRSRIGPVDVLTHDDDGPVRRERAQYAMNRCDVARLNSLRVALCHIGLGGRQLERQKVGEVRLDIGGAITEELGQARSHDRSLLVLARAYRYPKHGSDQIEHQVGTGSTARS